ncbi:MAG: YeeE/YedE family protein [Tepidamorphaceae bacterium]|nr:YeeE/YedE family protein [Rhodobiaceae bacterium]MCC0048838.1 YeeE/YedE family protein [Rhodobiaceae bacterium]
MLESAIDTYGDGTVLFAIGFAVGILFGAAAQHSRFCLRAATIEVFEGVPAGRMAVWLIVFFFALTATQCAIRFGWLDVSAARQIAATGSLSGAIIGGLMFGAGMILARGCASRLLVLSGTGNMRALVAGLVVTLVAQASYRGVLAPAREAIASLWTISGGADRDLSAILGIGRDVSIILAFLGLTAGIWLAARARIGLATGVSALLVGLAVTLGWLGTWAVASISFEVVPISSVTFTGPSTDTLMALVAEREIALSFGIGLVPGVFLGSAAMAALRGEWKLERFGADTPIERYLIGAVLMGFGAMLAGGCAVGAGVSGGAVLSLTAWVAAASMWAGALAMQIVLKPRPAAFVTS